MKAPLTPEQARLAADHIPIAKAVAARVCAYLTETATTYRFNTDDEIHAEALYLLCLCARKYDRSISASFGFYAKTLIFWRLIDFNMLPRKQRGRRLIPVDSKIADRGCYVWGPGFIDPERAVDQADLAWHEFARLPPRNAQAARLVLVEDVSIEEAARIMGCSYTHVIRLIRKCNVNDRLPDRDKHAAARRRLAEAGR